MTSVVLYLALLAAVSAERVAELALSRRNARRAFARGGVEVGTRHFRVMTVVHVAFLAACAIEVVLARRPWPGALGLVALALVLAAQGLRWWAIGSLGDRWNVRVIVVPGLAPITRGPYRFARHPNYLAVIVEIAALPLVHGAWATAIAFSAANACLLFVRIRAEERALGDGWSRAFAARPRFLPLGDASEIER